MIEETATVVAVTGGTAWVEAIRRTACGQCGHAEGCGTSTLARLFGARPNRLSILDDRGLRIGEQVVIGIPEGTLVRAAFMAYLLPLVILVCAAGLATAIGFGEVGVALAALLGLGLGLWLAGRLSASTTAHARDRPVLVRQLAPIQSIHLTPASPKRFSP